MNLAVHWILSSRLGIIYNNHSPNSYLEEKEEALECRLLPLNDENDEEPELKYNN